ncbi:hypothetical protein ACFVHB_34320 [Kitasatospora sp. NPDC127111]|uniref:hypothetical protein n=1 Tax=Kitasatospora sp. NPDC127111 TaxID=3345363 RepID=UPI0036373748
MTNDGNEQSVSAPHINPRLNTDLQFKLVSSLPRYNRTTDKPVEFFVTFYEDEYPTGLIWFCDEDDAAGFEWWQQLPNENAAIFWNDKLRRARARGLTPSQAVHELMSEPGTRLSGRILPDSRATAPSLTWLAELATHGMPVGEPAKPGGWRSDPPLSAERSEAARAGGGWLYQVDEGYDPAGRVPVHAVAGAWQTDTQGRVLRFWHNPAYGQPVEPAAEPAAMSAVSALEAGRRAAGRALLDWLADARAPRLCRVAGSSGSGRTHLLTWLAAVCPSASPHPDRRVHATVPADGLTLRSATWLLAARLGLVAGSPEELLEALQDGHPRTIVVTDLDRAGGDLVPDAPERIATGLLAPLARIPWIRLVVECASGSPAAAALHAADPRAAVLDLDDPRWTDRVRFAAWCAGLGGTPVDADLVYPNPGLAHLAVRIPAPSASDQTITLAEAWWLALPENERSAVIALADAGRPVTLATWAALPGAGGIDTVHRAVARLVPPADGVHALWRLAPQPVADLVTAVRPPADHAALARAVAETVPLLGNGRPDLAQADPVVVGILLRHSVLAGFADQLLGNPVVLVHADPAAVTAAFERTRAREGSTASDGSALLAEAWDLAGPACTTAVTPADRAAALHTYAAGRHQPAADALAAISGQRWRARWSHRPGTGRVRHLVRGRGPYRGHVAYSEHLSSGTTGILRFRDPRTGAPSPQVDPLRLPDGHHASLLIGDDGALVLLGRNGSVTTVPPTGEAPGDRLGTILDGITRRTRDALTAAAVAQGASGQVVALGDDSGDVSYIRTEGGLRSHKSLHRGPVTAVDLTSENGELLQISGGTDGTVWHWPHSGPDPFCVDARPHHVAAVSAAGTPRGLLTAAAWSDGLVRLRLHGPAGADPVDLRLGRPVCDLTVTSDGQVCIALADSVLAVELT